MPPLPQQSEKSKTVEAIYAARAKVKAPARTGTLDVAGLAHGCPRYIWNVFRWIGGTWSDHAGMNIFPIDSTDQMKLLTELAGVCSEVVTVDPETQRPVTFHDVGGHVACQMDAAALGVPEAPKTWHVVLTEFYRTAEFVKVKSAWVEKADPALWLQAQFLMHKTGMDRALILAQNIDNDQLFSERMEKNKAGAAIAFGAKKLIERREPFPILDVKSAQCQGCQFFADCHGHRVPQVNCRTCLHSTPLIIDGSPVGLWQCEKHGKRLTGADQEAACEDHLFIPMTINGARHVDAGEDDGGDWVQYEKPDGTKFVNSKQEGGYRSKELTMLPWEAVGNEKIQELKDAVGATVVMADESPRAPLSQWADGMAQEAANNAQQAMVAAKAGAK